MTGWSVFIAALAGWTSSLIAAGVIDAASATGAWGPHGHRLADSSVVAIVLGSAVLTFLVVLAIERSRGPR